MFEKTLNLSLPSCMVYGVLNFDKKEGEGKVDQLCDVFAENGWTIFESDPMHSGQDG